MQIIERSIYGLRSARITLEAPGKPAFTLFPMIHVADKAFFTSVRDDAATHDLVLYEGVRAHPAWIASRSYRLAAGGAASLAYQGDHIRTSDLGRAVHADMDGRTFMGRWRKLPLWFRAMFLVLLPFVFLATRFAGARRRLAGVVGDLNDTANQSDLIPGDGALGQLRELLLTERDAVLATACDRAIAEGAADTIAVIYGAAHMPALIQHLYRAHGYRPARSEWMMAIGT